MSNPFKNLRVLLNSVESILKLRTIDRGFTFTVAGAYLFVSPISGIVKIKVIKDEEADRNSERFINFKLIGILELDEDLDYYEMMCAMRDNINELNEFQRHTIKMIGTSKVQVFDAGYYNLQLTHETVNYVNYWKNEDSKPYYLFNGIESALLGFYLNNLMENEKRLDDYLNDPFYDFYYNLDGFFIHKYRLPETVTSRLIVGNIYKCKVEYKNSAFSPINPILTIKYIQ